MRIKEIIIGVLVVALLGLGVLYSVNAPTQVPAVSPSSTPSESPIGAAPGMDVNYPIELHDGLTQSSLLATSTTGTATTLREKDLLNKDTISYATVNVSGTTLTLPSSSTITSMVKTSGAKQTTCIYNATSTAANITIAAGTGIDLISATSSLTIGSNKHGCLTFIRQADRDITAIWEKYFDAD